MDTVERAFRAGYHCQWLRKEKRYIFDPEMLPGDPEGAFRAWLAALATGDESALGKKSQS